MKTNKRFQPHSFLAAALALAALGLMLATTPAHAANRWWDGGTASLAGNGTWRTAITNRDKGAALPDTNWVNAANDIAIFGGTAGQVNLGTGNTVGGLLMQTNNLANGISANTNDWSTVSGSAGTNQVNLTIDPTKPAEFYRMVYP